MTHEIIISGFGGQGVMSIGKTIAEAAMTEGKFCSWLPSYGPEMRGGTANCSVVVSDEEIICPLIVRPTELIAMNKPSLIKFEPAVQENGAILVNSSIIEIVPTRKDVKCVLVPCIKIAEELGNQKVANMAMLGAYIETTKLLKTDTIKEMLREMFTGPKAALVDLNIEALRRGAQCAKEQL